MSCEHRKKHIINHFERLLPTKSRRSDHTFFDHFNQLRYSPLITGENLIMRKVLQKLFLIPFELLPFTLATAQDGLIAKGARVVTESDGYIFLEGPASDKAGNLYFTDIDNNRIHMMTPDKKYSVKYEPSNHANGLFIDLDGDLLICEQSAVRITKMDKDGNVSVVIGSYKGIRFNSTNDVWVHPNGSLYFTDPYYTHPLSGTSQDGNHVYHLASDRTTINRVVHDMVQPNGVIGTEDGKTLYISDTTLNKTFSFTIMPDGGLSQKKVFAHQGSDGMTMDERGNVYLTWNGGVSVYSPIGDKIEFIELPQEPANVTFGGINKNILYMTARTALFSIKMNVKSSR